MLLFLFLVIFNNFFIIPVVRENTKVNNTPTTECAATLAKEIIVIPPFAADSPIKILSV